MFASINPAEVPAVKDDTGERPIPTAWRATLVKIVSALKDGDYGLEAGIPGVVRPTAQTAEHIRRFIRAYGAELVDLPEATWESSVCIWYSPKWSALIDLWTRREGRSDLVLRVDVVEQGDGYSISIDLVYVP